MSELRLYVDEDASERAVVRGLRSRGFDLLTANEAGRLTLSDSEQLEYATQTERAIYTFNIRDFARSHRDVLAQEGEHAGIIAIPEQRYAIGEKIRRLSELLLTIEAEEMKNQIEFLLMTRK